MQFRTVAGSSCLALLLSTFVLGCGNPEAESLPSPGLKREMGEGASPTGKGEPSKPAEPAPAKN